MAKFKSFEAFNAAAVAATTVADLETAYSSVVGTLDEGILSQIDVAYAARKSELSVTPNNSNTPGTKVRRIAPRVLKGQEFKGILVSTLTTEDIGGKLFERKHERVIEDGFVRVSSVTNATTKTEKIALTVIGTLYYYDKTANELVSIDYHETTYHTKASFWTVTQGGVPMAYEETADNPLFFKLLYEKRIHMHTSYKDEETDEIIYNVEHFELDAQRNEVPYHVDGYYSLRMFIKQPALMAARTLTAWTKKSDMYEIKRVEAMAAASIEKARASAKVSVAEELYTKAIGDDAFDIDLMRELLAGL